MLTATASRTPRIRAALVLGVLVALLAALLAPATPAAAKAPDPEDDYYRIPQGCAGPARPEAQSPRGCRLTPWVRGRPTVMLWGDSHAWQNIPALIRAAKLQRVNLTAFAMGSCPPAKLRIRKSYPGKCEQSNALALKYVRKMSRRKKPLQVILGSNWAGWRQMADLVLVRGTVPKAELDRFFLRMIKLFHRRTEKLFPALRQTRARLAVIAQTATCQNSPGQPPFDCTLPRRKAIQHEGRTRRWLAGLTGRAPQIDVNRAFCGAKRCRGRSDGIYTFWDWGHLSKTRNLRMYRYFVPLLRRLRR